MFQERGWKKKVGVAVEVEEEVEEAAAAVVDDDDDDEQKAEETLLSSLLAAIEDACSHAEDVAATTLEAATERKWLLDRAAAVAASIFGIERRRLTIERKLSFFSLQSRSLDSRLQVLLALQRCLIVHKLEPGEEIFGRRGLRCSTVRATEATEGASLIDEM